jgi:hypothetical protein
MEALLARDAQDEAAQGGWLAQLLTLSATFLAGTAIGLSTKKWDHAALDTGLSVLTTEAQFWTQPTGCIDALTRYRAGTLAEAPPTRSVSWWIVPLSSNGQMELSLIGLF